MDGYAFSHQVRVRFAETDAQAIAHHASYVVWLEEARVAYLAAYSTWTPVVSASMPFSRIDW